MVTLRPKPSRFLFVLHVSIESLTVGKSSWMAASLAALTTIASHRTFRAARFASGSGSLLVGEVPGVPGLAAFGTGWAVVSASADNSSALTAAGFARLQSPPYFVGRVCGPPPGGRYG